MLTPPPRASTLVIALSFSWLKIALDLKYMCGTFTPFLCRSSFLCSFSHSLRYMARWHRVEEIFIIKVSRALEFLIISPLVVDFDVITTTFPHPTTCTAFSLFPTNVCATVALPLGGKVCFSLFNLSFGFSTGSPSFFGCLIFISLPKSSQ